MSRPSPLPKLFAEASEATEHLRVVRQSAREKAVASVRMLEGALINSLDGETLRGLPELARGFSAARVRGERADEQLPEPKPFEERGRGVLVVSPSGVLLMAWSVRGAHATRVADDTDLLVEDVEAVAQRFAEVLRVHVERSRRTAERFGRLEALAERVASALAEPANPGS